MEERISVDGREYATSLKIANKIRMLLVRAQLLRMNHKSDLADKCEDEAMEILADALFTLDAYEVEVA
jgi:hypothetical protein